MFFDVMGSSKNNGCAVATWLLSCLGDADADQEEPLYWNLTEFMYLSLDVTVEFSINFAALYSINP